MVRTLALLAVAVSLACANPLAGPQPALDTADVDASNSTLALDERAAQSFTCHTTGSNVRYRTGPSTGCPSCGQYGKKGSTFTYACSIGEWVKNSKGYYVYGLYVDSCNNALFRACQPASVKCPAKC